MKSQKAISASLLLFLGAVNPSGISADAEAAAADSCSRHFFDTKPLWVSGATVDGNRLVAVDAFRNTVLAYDMSGSLVTDKAPVTFKAEKIYPVSVDRGPLGSILVSTVNSRLLTMDSTLRSVASDVSLYNTAAPAPRGIGTVYDWTVVGTDLVGFGAVLDQTSARGFSLGYFRAPLAQPDSVEWLTEQRVTDGAPYQLGGMVTCAVNNDAFMLELGEEAFLLRAQPGKMAERLTRLPDLFAKTPRVKTVATGPKDAASLYAEIETQTRPIALFSVSNHVFLLGRSRSEKLGQQFLLYRFDTAFPAAGWSEPAEIFTQAHHLSVAPGLDGVAIVERGEVGPGQSQEIPSFLWLSSQELTSFQASARLCGSAH
jgi:hypothetical protein